MTIVTNYVLGQRQQQRDVFAPLQHDPGHAQADFGEALAVIGEVECKIHFFVIDLPHSDACAARSITHHVHILEKNGDNYRLKQSKRRQRAAEVANAPGSPRDE